MKLSFRSASLRDICFICSDTELAENKCFAFEINYKSKWDNYRPSNAFNLG
jgi:hypothetical protein